MRPYLHIVGRFPPPVDGQSLATARLAGMLQTDYTVHTFDTALKTQSLTPSGLSTQLHTARHYLSLRKRLRAMLSVSPEAPVLWGAISPTPRGHARDMVVTVPQFRPGQAVIAIAHRGGFNRIFESAATAWSARRLIKRVHRFVFTSTILADEVAQWIMHDRVSIIPYTVEPCASDAEVAIKQRRRVPGAPLHALYLSNMIVSKGYLDTLEGIAQANARGVSVKLTCVGRWNTDADRTQFNTKVLDLGLQKLVSHHGFVSDRKHINALHRKADVFLLPTYYSEEAQPISIIEALSASTPVVVTPHRGIADMVRQDLEARFVQPKTPADIAEALEDLADVDTWQQSSRHARARYRQRFSQDTVKAMWLELVAQYTGHPTR